MSLHVAIVKKCLSVIPANPMSKLCMKAWPKDTVADLSFDTLTLGFPRRNARAPLVLKLILQ